MGTFDTKINFGGPTTPPPTPPPGLTLVLAPGVVVNSSGSDAVNLANIISPHPINPPAIGVSGTILASDANITVVNATGQQAALRTQLSGSSSIGTAADPVSGTINVTSSGQAQGIFSQVFASVPNETSSVYYNGTGPSITDPDITVTGGSGSTVIQACANAGCDPDFYTNTGVTPPDGNAIINAAGNFKIVGLTGLDAVAGGNGNATVNYNSGTIDLMGGSFSDGIFASAGGSAEITTLPGTTIIVSSAAPGPTGIEAFSDNAAASANVASAITINGNQAVPTTNYKSNPTGVRAQSDLGGDVSVTYTGPGIMVHGGGGLGIVALSGSQDNTTKSGSVTVNASGPISADGSNAVGILADSGTVRNQAASTPRPPALTTGPVQIAASNVAAPGQFGTAISATGGGGGVLVNIPQGGSIMGGWQATPFTIPTTPLVPGIPPTSVTPPGSNIGSASGLPASGIFLSANGGGTATLTNSGSIGALSDLAIFGDPVVINNGLITGFVQFAGGGNSILNNGTFDLRNFAETTGNADGTTNGVRDTVRVAVANLGAGANNGFTNNGILALPQVTGATMLNSGGQYLPLGNTNNAMALNGPLQGQLFGVATFTNSGTIDLQANPVPGDVLVITGSSLTVNPLLSAAPFSGTYISNGGSLKLDTVLNEGGAATRSDTLVVDGTTVGPNGATKIFFNNAGGAGALTVGDGILVVQVLDPLRSDPTAFTPGDLRQLQAGPFTYLLLYGGVNGNNPGDWFLRNAFMAPPSNGGGTTPPSGGTTPPNDTTPPSAEVPTPTPPVDPFPPDPPPDPLPPSRVFPIVGPRLSAYGVVQPIARQMGLSQLGTLHERIGDTLTLNNAGPDAEGWARSAWGRVVGQQIDNRYQAFADPRADGHIVGMQAGLDLLRASFQPGHRDVAGLYFSYLNGNADVDGLVTNLAASAYALQHTGTVNLNAYSLGGYWTHYGPGDWYLDAVLQGTKYGGNTTATFAPLGFGFQSNLSTSGSGFVASLEGGYPIPLPQLGPNFILEPQAQIIWQQTDFGQTNDGLGTVALGSTYGTTGRLGVRGQWTIPDANGVLWQPYGRFNVWQDWGGAADTLFSAAGVSVPLLNHSTRLEFAGGLTYKLQSNLSFYAQAGYEFAIAPDNVQRDGFKGDIGLRYTW